MNDLYSIGEMVIDFIPGTEARSYVANPGGAPTNVAIAVAKNGLSSSMCCKVGDDDFGRFLMDTLHQYGVKAAAPQLCEEAITTMAFVTLQEDGERTFTFARKPGADMFLSEEDVKDEDIEDSVIIHAGSCSLSAQPVRAATEKAMRLGAEKGKIVSFDVNYRNLMWKDDQDACVKAVFGVLPYVNLLKISEEELEMMGGRNELKGLMEKYKIDVLVLTLSSAGADAYFKGGVIHSEGRRAEKVLDATGAGDAFWGGFLSSLRMQGVEKTSDLNEEIIRKAMDWGNVSGCICVQGKGAIPSIPTREQIEDYIRKEN